MIEIDSAELGIGSNNVHHYDNYGHCPIDIFVEWNGIMSFVIFVSFSVWNSYRIEFVSCNSKIFKNLFSILGATKKKLLHVTHCIMSLLFFDQN